MLKIDLHLHTNDDPVDILPFDGRMLVDRAAVIGFHALAITLHHRQLEDPSLTRYARERGIVLIAGVERTIEGKHVLLINFPRESEQVRTFDDLRRLRRHRNGLVVAPHPFYPTSVCVGSRLDEHTDLFDALEWSYFWTPVTNFNARAARWALARGKPLIGNSDLHDLRQLGRTFTWVSAEHDADAICAAVRAGRVRLQTEPVPPLELARVFGGMMWRALRRPQGTLEPAPSP